MTHRSWAGASRRAWLLRAVLALSSLAMLALLTVARAEATDIAPTKLTGSAICTNVKEQRKELAVEPVVDGGPHAFDDGTLSGTYTRTGDTLDWTSDELPVDYVLVRGGGDTNYYQYPGGTTADTGLVAPADGPIDSILFCYDNQNRGRLTIVKQTDPAGATQQFSFHASADLRPGDFTLGDGQSITLRPKPGTYTVTEADTPGWKVESIVCDDTDSTGSGGTATVIVNKAEQITCLFTNAKEKPKPPAAKPPVAVTPAGPASSPPAVVAVAPRPAAQAVEAARVSSRASARLRPPTRCVSGSFRITVAGSPVRRIAFTVNGRHVRTAVARSGRRTFTVRLPAGRGTMQRIAARVTFANGARSRTLRTTVLRCAPRPVVRPQFTG